MATDNDAFLAQIINRGDADLAKEAAEHKAEHLQRAVRSFSRNLALANAGKIDPVTFADFQETFGQTSSPSTATSSASSPEPTVQLTSSEPTATESPLDTVKRERELTRLRNEVTSLNAENERLNKAHNAAVEKLTQEHDDEIAQLKAAHAQEIKDLEATHERKLAEAKKPEEKPAEKPAPEPTPAPAEDSTAVETLQKISAALAPAMTATLTAYPANSAIGYTQDSVPGIQPEDRVIPQEEFSKLQQGLSDAVQALEDEPSLNTEA